MNIMVKATSAANAMDKKTLSPSRLEPAEELMLSHGIQTDKVNCWFGQKHVVHQISMKMKPRQVTAIIGPSGCGKSTFIRCINRMHEVVPEARMDGQILLDGADIMELDPVLLRRRVGMVFQKAQPFPTMTIFDNVAAGLRLNGAPHRQQLTSVVEQS